MRIPTSQDRALVSACCPCALPQCPGPEIEHQSLSGTGNIAWVIYTYSLDTYYQARRTDYGDGGFIQHRMSQPFTAYFSPGLPEGGVSVAVDDWTEGDPQTGGSTVTHLDPIDIGAARSSCYDALAGAVDWDSEEFAYGVEQMSRRQDFTPTGTGSLVLHARWVRYRIGVPADFSTTENPRGHYEVEWDEVEASEDWWIWFDAGMEGEEPAGGPVLVASKSWLWGGDMEAPWSDWHELSPPDTSENERRVVNLMVKCWKSQRLGVAPTAHGDLVELGS